MLLRKLGKGCNYHDKGQSNLGRPTKTSLVPQLKFQSDKNLRHNTFNVKHEWRPKVFNGVVGRACIKDNNFPRGRSNEEIPISLNPMSLSRNTLFNGLNKIGRAHV